MSFACSFDRPQDREAKTAPPMPQGHSYQTNYVLNAIHYALAIDLNRHHNDLQKRSMGEHEFTVKSLQAKKQGEGRNRTLKNTHFKIITSIRGTQEEFNFCQNQTAKPIPRTQTDQPDHTSASGELPRPITSTPLSIINQKQPSLQLSTKNHPTQRQQIDEEEGPFSHQFQDAELPELGLPFSEMISKKESLMTRLVDSFPLKSKKGKVPRQIKGLLG